MGTIYHTWWICSKFKNFLVRVHSLIYLVTKNIVKNSKVALLNEPIEGIPRHTQILIYFMFLEAKIKIATAWKSSVVNLVMRNWKLM